MPPFSNLNIALIAYHRVVHISEDVQVSQEMPMFGINAAYQVGPKNYDVSIIEIKPTVPDPEWPDPMALADHVPSDSPSLFSCGHPKGLAQKVATNGWALTPPGMPNRSGTIDNPQR